MVFGLHSWLRRPRPETWILKPLELNTTQKAKELL
jgi:hypothetical protein